MTLAIVLTFIAGGNLTQVYAQQISPQQIEQFKKLPKSQQQALAQSMGVDLAAIEKQIQGSGKSEAQSAKTETFPRGTQFDAQGNPMAEQEELAVLEPSDKLKAFGYDVFANSPQTFAPMMDIAIPAEYVIGPGDSISVQVFGKEVKELELTVNREGQVVVPSLGPFTVSGLTFNEMKRLLTARVKERIIGVDVVIGMASLRSMRIFVLGDAFKPGPYTLSSLSSITHALFAAGGISDIGSLRNIQLKRAGKLVQTLDLYDLLISGDSSSDVLLQSGDVVFIAPKGSTVNVKGEVRRPAIYELTEDCNFNDILTMSGGLLPTAFATTTRVERYNQNALRSVVNLDLTNASDLAKRVHAGDAVHVMKAAEMFEQSVTVIGAVTRPGKYQWQAGQRITDIFPNIDSHLLPSADLNYSIVVREIDIARNIEVLQFDLAKAVSTPNSKDNLVLQGNDKILVFANKKSQASRQRLLKPIIEKLKRQGKSGQFIQLVEADGEIKFPGVYPLAKNGRVADLIAAAGGLTESAYVVRAELTRNQIVDHMAQQKSLAISLSAALIGEEKDNVLLTSKDRLNIHKIPAWSENNVVELRGEFVFPGKYTVRRGESLANLIAKAGGFTQFAHQEGSVLTRVQLRAIEKKNLSKLTADLRIEMASKSMSDQNYSQSYAEVQQMLTDMEKVKPIGRLVIDLPKVVNDKNYDVLLEGGDVLYVPTVKNSVNVVGQVQVTSSHIFDAALSAADYLAQSGGSKKRADTDRTYIISANGSIKMMNSGNWFTSDADDNLAPGDTIVVPLNAEYMNNLALWSSVTSIIYNSAVAVAAISGI